MRLFNFGRANRLFVVRIVDEKYQPHGWWLNGRILGFYVSIQLYRKS